MFIVVLPGLEKFMLRIFRSIGLIVSFGLALNAWGQSQIEKPNVRLAVGGKPALYYLPLTIADQLGFFKDEGLQVEISDFQGGAKALQAVVGGSADVVSGAYEHTIYMQAKGQMLQAFVLQGRAPQMSLGISKAKAASYKSPKDLKGMKVGVSAPGSSTQMLLNYVLAQGGLEPSDVSVIATGAGAGVVAAVKSGQVDAMSNADPAMTKLERDGDIVIVANTRTMAGTEAVFGGPMPAGSLYAPVDFIKKNPNTVQALANAIVRALKWLQKATPEQVANTAPQEYLLGDRAVYMQSFVNIRDALSPDGEITEAGAKNTLRVLAGFTLEIRPAQIKIEQTYTNEFARRANSKYR